MLERYKDSNKYSPYAIALHLALLHYSVALYFYGVA